MFERSNPERTQYFYRYAYELGSAQELEQIGENDGRPKTQNQAIRGSPDVSFKE